jgi:hypothetical protein
MVKEVLEGTTDLRNVVLLEEQPALAIVADTMFHDSAWIIDYQPETVRIGVTSSDNSLLVLTDVWFNSWQVNVDAHPAKCLRAYGAFRAVELPAGSREVVFEYHSHRYGVGKLFTLLTLLFGVGIIAVAIWREKSHAPETVQAIETD